MLAFGIRYLNGFVAAAEPDNLERAEWPPHPARVFMALAAAHFQTGGELDERGALLWLEGTKRGGEISAPMIAAPEGARRDIVQQFVPVNDKAIWKKDPAKPKKKPAPPLQAATGIMRERQPRVFPRVWLDNETVYLIWPNLNLPDLHRDTLVRLCSKVTRIGHSSSLVQMWIAENEEINEPNWVPDEERALTHLRIPGPGTLDYLEQLYNTKAIEDYGELLVAKKQINDLKLKKAAKKRLRDEYGNQPPPQQRPRLSLYQGYARPAQEAATTRVASTVFGPHFLVLQLRAKQGQYQQLDLTSTLAIVGRWREAILSNSNSLAEPVRRMLSGHDANGGPAADPHMAYLPLAFVGYEHADGHQLGMGLVLPAELSVDDRRQALRAIALVSELRLGPLGVWTPKPMTASQPPWNLRAET